MSIKNTPIIVRLLLGFAAMLAMAGVMAGLSIQHVRTLAELSDRMYRHPLAVIHNIHSAKEGVLAVRQQMNHVLHTSAEELETIRRLVDDYDTRMVNNMIIIRRQYLGPMDDVDAIDSLLANWRIERMDHFRLAQEGRQPEAFERVHQTDLRLAPLLDERIRRIQGFATNRAAWFNAEANRTATEMNRATAVLLAGLLLVGALAALIITRGIVRPLYALRDAMEQLARGDLSTEVPLVTSRSELGAMARAVQIFKDEGRRTEAQRWVRSHVAELSGAMRTADSYAELAGGLLSRLVPLLRGAGAAFYVRDPQSGRLTAEAWYARPDGAPATLEAGTGSAGQCAQDGQLLVLTELPPERFGLTTALGTASPVALVAAPVIWDEQVLAVLELVAFQAPSERELALIEALMPAIGVNMAVLGRTLRTRELLQQSRQQAEQLQASEEELQSQSEELRQGNELLQRQAEALRSSEEELRVQAEELQNSYDELSRKTALLQEREAALEQARGDAERRAVELEVASRYKSEFLANMSHELRTPLNSMLILAQTLAANEEGHLSPDEVESARIVHEGGTHLLSLINDILDLSKIEAGKLELVVEEFTVADLGGSIERRFQHMASARGLEFSVATDPSAPGGLRADRRKLDQILNNLLGNALKFTERGAVRVAIGTRGEGVLAVTVRDTGVGIARAKQERIFDAFEQGDGSTSRRFGGTGLGLAISRKLAQLMGGDIAVESEEGQGSTFTLTLPVAAAAGAPVAAAAPATPQSALAPAAAPAPVPTPRNNDAAPQLLLIEDDPTFARIVCDLARSRGFGCVVAGSGDEGLALAQRLHPTGIILDIGLPGQDGWSVMERLKRDPATAAIPVHFMSAFDESLRGLGMGAVGFYVKPVTREQIESAFERINLVARRPPRTVLVLDRDPGSRALVAELVRGAGTTIIEAQDGGQALELLEREEVDCLIVDLGLPDRGELDFLDQLALTRGEAAPPVVIYSNHELDDEAVLRLRSYTDSIIIKGKRSQERLLDEVALFMHRVGGGSRPAAARPDGNGELAGRTVLLVDDDMRNTFALAKVLRAKGLKVVMAQDGDKALAQLADHPETELVLMDIMMPGKDGYQCIREMRERPEWRRLPVIALTARAMPGDRDRCLEAGANDYMTKPVDLDRLLSTMRVWLQQPPPH